MKESPHLQRKRRRTVMWLMLSPLTASTWAQDIVVPKTTTPAEDARAVQLNRLQEFVAVSRAQDLFETLASNPNYSVWTRLVRESGLTSVLAGTEALTVFAPNDSAWQDHADTAAVLTSTPIIKKQIVLRHVCAGIYSGKAMAGASYTSLAGTPVQIDADAQHANRAHFVVQDIKARNGMLHLLGGVLI
jgi:uncharacterized surface protein with fasciclin (FAS1) repeats